MNNNLNLVVKAINSSSYSANFIRHKPSIYHKPIEEKVSRISVMEKKLHFAIKYEKFKLYYQPVVSLKTGIIVGVEAMLGWANQREGLLFSEQFIDIAEEQGLTEYLGNWALKEACQQLYLWQQSGLLKPDFLMNINIFMGQINDVNFGDKIDKILATNKIKPQNIALGINQDTLLKNTEASLKLCQQLRGKGIKLTLDKFGIGYSSTSYLHSFLFDNVKLDKSLITTEDSSQNIGLIPAIICLAKEMGLTINIEGIESNEELKQVRNLKCDFSQGNLFSEPVDAETIERMICNNYQW